LTPHPHSFGAFQDRMVRKYRYERYKTEEETARKRTGSCIHTKVQRKLRKTSFNRQQSSLRI
jgi:hypothetical protein